MGSGMFRGKESSNRIELSRLVQDLLIFGVFGSLWLWGWGRCMEWMWLGVPPTHMHMHAQAHMHTNAHARVVNMIISCKWLPHWGNPWEFPMMSYVHACVHACACTHVGGHPLTTPHPHPPTPPPPRNQSKFNSTLTN